MLATLTQSYDKIKEINDRRLLEMNQTMGNRLAIVNGVKFRINMRYSPKTKEGNRTQYQRLNSITSLTETASNGMRDMVCFREAKTKPSRSHKRESLHPSLHSVMSMLQPLKQLTTQLKYRKRPGTTPDLLFRAISSKKSKVNPSVAENAGTKTSFTQPSNEELEINSYAADSYV